MKNPDFAAACLTALLHASLLVSGAWLLLLGQRKASAARRSLTCRLAMASILVITAITVLPPAFLRRSAPPAPAIPLPAPLPQYPGSDAQSTLFAVAQLYSPATTSSASGRNSLPNPLTTPLRIPPEISHGLVSLWLAGGSVVMLVWVRSLIHRRRILRGSHPADSLPGLLEATDIPGWTLVDDVRLLPGEITPCVWGIRKTTLALPRSAATWPADRLRLVLAHECAHLLRRDPLWNPVTRAFLALLWFHPLAWNLARRSQTAEEQAADDAVLHSTRDAPSYAAVLVECARQFTPAHRLGATSSAMATSASLTARVEAILSSGTDRRSAGFRSLLIRAAFLALVSTAISLTAPGIVIAQDQNPETQTAPVPTPPGQPHDDFENGAVTSQSAIFPPRQPPGRKTYQFTGSAKITSTQLSLEADQITMTTNEGDSSPLLLTARGKVSLKGIVKTRAISAVGEDLSISNETGEMILTGWPRANLPDHTFEATKPEAKIMLRPGGISSEHCLITTPANTQDPVHRLEPDSLSAPQTNHPPDPMPLSPGTEKDNPQEKEDHPPFDWKVISIRNLDYVPLDRLSAFYKFPRRITGDDGTFELRSPTMIIKGARDSREIRINNVRFILRHPVESPEGNIHIPRWDLGTLLDPVIRPQRNKLDTEVNTMVIDPGHGGNDPGTGHALDTALRLKGLLEASGLKVVLTRSDDRRVPHDELTGIAEAQENALLISLHFGNGKGQADQGIRTYFPAVEETHDGNAAFLQNSTQLAVAVHANCLYKLRGRDGGIRTDNSAMLARQTKTPAILMECGTLANPESAARVATETHRQNLAEAIAGGVRNYLKATDRQPGN